MESKYVLKEIDFENRATLYCNNTLLVEIIRF